jgi:hypothetical protein
MYSSAHACKDGRNIWTVIHDAQRGIENLEAEGELPEAFVSIRDRLLSRQRAEGPKSCDYVFDIPVETAMSVTGYRHDQVIGGITDEPFEILSSE